LEKFGVQKNFADFHRVVTLGMGYYLGIFDYLEKKVRPTPPTLNIPQNTSVSFSLDELNEHLKLNKEYLKAWLILTIGLGVFEHDREHAGFFKTAPHVYDLLINSESKYPIRSAYMWIYQFIVLQNDIFDKFKHGGYLTRKSGEIVEKAGIEGQRFSSSYGFQRLSIFNNNYKEFNERLDKGGFILEVGCGHGFNLEHIGKMYKNARIIGLDINLKSVKNARKVAEKHGWSDRMEIFNTSIDNYLKSVKSDTSETSETFKPTYTQSIPTHTFDLIIMNEVLHEIITDESQRIEIVNNLYDLLKEDGILIIGERPIPDILEIESKATQDVFHGIMNWVETCYGARIYTEKSIRSFLSSLRFKEDKIEQLGEGNGVFWVLRKG
jgi:ubiquinone/menaquinone biosynthesis C-methylase UbiE